MRKVVVVLLVWLIPGGFAQLLAEPTDQLASAGIELASTSEASTKVRPRAPQFRTPTRLEKRVAFWRDIFTVYGKNQSVIHHRDFPQAVFSVVDLTQEAATLGPVQFERHKSARVKEEIARVQREIKLLAGGAQPTSALGRQVADAMILVPGGREKFARTLKEDLVRSQTGIREKYGEAIKRSGRYMHTIEKIFVGEFGLPVELTRLPFIESSFDYQAYSSVGAAGIWQFMRATGRLYMTVNNIVDERRDVIASTRGAARYLQSAYNSLGSWPLAITSYNHGVVGVARKVKKFGSNNLAAIIEHPGERLFGFASSNFYPEFLAALDVYDDHARYFPDIVLERPLTVSEVRLKGSASIQHVLRQFPELTLDELKALNYAVSPAVWQGRYRLPAGYSLKVPARFAPKLAVASAESIIPPEVPPASSVYGGVTYKVRPGDTLSLIARKYGTSVSALMELNDLTTTNVRVGALLRVKGESLSKKARPDPIAPPEDVEAPVRSYKVKSGDSLWTISRKFRVSVEDLKRLNRLPKGIIKPGQLIKLP